ncbi:hypothetical protein XELAEV_18043718mg [Xenopus laevis]|uniref:Uncharacterized protein n=1 Tax=Xenopus laevis TaxID=8355 RepID=A0A974BXG2_XENLA|nr:hypothetical protein XELAEV_18043718mg [Xenopus laevis]
MNERCRAIAAVRSLLPLGTMLAGLSAAATPLIALWCSGDAPDPARGGGVRIGEGERAWNNSRSTDTRCDDKDEDNDEVKKAVWTDHSGISTFKKDNDFKSLL